MKISSRYFCSLFILISLISNTFSLIQTAFASTFTDVSYEHPHSTAISYLQSYDIVDGYPDGTFRPDQLINRVEFLKIILEGTGVTLDVANSTGFSDVDETEWYGPYIKKAKKEGWIQGYPDNTFKPTQSINKVEALKIVGEVQNWDRLAREEVPEAAFKDTYRFSWYSPYVHFAKENNLLFDETDYLYPDQPIDRGYMAELVYNTIIEDVIEYKAEKTAEELIREENVVETPENFTKIDINFFNNVTLDTPLPNTFYKNEIYILEGNFTTAIPPNDVFAFISSDGNNSYKHFIGKIEDKHFEIPLIFSESGNFHLGIVPGLSGESKITPVYVLDGIPPEGIEANNDIPSNLSMDFENDRTSIEWETNLNNVFRIYFMQENTIQSYFVRDKISLDIFYRDFWRFEEGATEWRVYGAQADTLYPLNLTSRWAKSADYSFNAILHNFKLFSDVSITYSEIPEHLPEPQPINVSGSTNENIFAEGAVITPSGSIDFFEIETTSELQDYYGNKIIPAGSDFSFIYSPLQSGTHILEINNEGGYAIINVPVYIGEGIPLIPDFFDLQDPFEVTYTIDIESARDELLNYINVERVNHGLNPVIIKEDLNVLAQEHTDDMYNRYFFSHINPDGESPYDRRLRHGIQTEVGENLANAPTLYFAHQALMRSAIHRQNILHEDWDTIGLGITLDDGGYLIIAEEFSHNPWTQTDLENFENELVSQINNIRLNPLQSNSELRDIAREWSRDMIDQNYFSFYSPSGINLIDVVKNSGVTDEGRAYILKNGTLDTLLDNLVNDSDILNEGWNKVGIGIKQTDFSNLFVTVIYTQ